MPAQGFTLTQALSALGVARVFIGDPETADGLEPIPTEGEITATVPENLNRLTAPELTGDVAHDAWVTPGQIVVTVPVIYTGAAQLASLSALGSASAGHSAPQRPTYTSLVIIPLLEMDNTVDPPEISYNGTAWDPVTPPANAVWFWRVVPRRPDFGWGWENAGKRIFPVEFEVFHDATKPAGHKLFTVGNPVTAGITTVRL